MISPVSASVPACRAGTQRSRSKEKEEKFSPRPPLCNFKKLFIFGKTFFAALSAFKLDFRSWLGIQ